jgi:dolichol-phosphate mannosyltransferase
VKVSVIVPTYNERDNLEELFARIDNALKDYDYEIIVVDDDSPDRTWEFAQQLSDRYPVRVIRRTEERGLSSAVFHLKVLLSLLILAFFYQHKYNYHHYQFV